MFRSRNQNPPTYASLFKNIKGKAAMKTACDKNTTTTTTGVLPLEQQTRLAEPISYESFMKIRKNLVQEQLNPQDNQSYLPIKYITLHLVILTFISFILIGLQIVVIQRNQQFSYIGAGIWMGVYNLILTILSVASSKKN